MNASQPVVTFDLFSALLDSRTGGADALDRISAGRGWQVPSADVYDRWDVHNKAAQHEASQRPPGSPWRSYRDLCAQALVVTYGELGLAGDPVADADALVESTAGWPPWPDVEADLARLAEVCRVGVLSNVDDDVLRHTRVADLVDLEVAFTSQRLRAYKPSARIYTEAGRRLAGGSEGVVHVAASARDVRGALEAGIAVVRLRRPGHALDPEGQRPPYEVDTAGGISAVLPAMTGWRP